MTLDSRCVRFLLVGLLLLGAGGGCGKGDLNHGIAKKQKQDDESGKKKQKKIKLDLAGLPEQVKGLYHAGSVGIIMSGWLGAINYGVIVANDVDALLAPAAPVPTSKSTS